MNNVIPPLQNPVVTQPLVDGSLTAGIENPPVDLGNLLPGENLLLEIRSNNLGRLIAGIKLQISGKSLEIPLSLNLNRNLDLPPDQTLQLQARVIAQQPQKSELRIVTINGQKPDLYLRKNVIENILALDSSAPALQKDISDPLQSLRFFAPKIQNLLAPLLDELQLPPPVKQLFSAALETILLQIQIKASPVLPKSPIETIQNLPLPQKAEPQIFAQPQTLSALRPQLQNLATELPIVPENLTAEVKNSLIPPLANRLTEIIQPFLPAEISGRVSLKGETAVLQTVLGDVLPEQPLKLPLETKILLTVKIIHLHSLSSISASSPHHLAEPALGQQVLDLLKPLQQQLPSEVFQQLTGKIPAAGPKMLSNIIAFMKASSSHDLSSWLGAPLVERLSLSGKDGQEVLQKLDALLLPRQSETPGWRIIEIPFYNVENLSRIRIAVRQPQDEDAEKESAGRKKPKASRFVVDTSFSRLGNFQFDGFSLPTDRRFDLVVRTQKEIPDDFCSQLMHIFRQSLSEVGYAGNIKINVKENFIKICEDQSLQPILQEGILI